MATKHPYVVGAGGLTKAVAQFRKAFPATVTGATLTKLGIAPNNESYVVNTLRFLKLIDDSGKKTEAAAGAFSQHPDPAFQAAFAELIKKAYSELFALHGDDAWTLSSEQLISFFRGTDQSTAIVGQRQASTFQTLAALVGKSTGSTGAGRTTEAKRVAGRVPRPRAIARTPTKAPAEMSTEIPAEIRGIGLSVRIEVNLPAVTDQATYDAIFASIRKNLIDLK